MAPMSKTLYRIMLKSCKEIFLPQNREFLQASMDACTYSILQLSNGAQVLKRLPHNPKLELKQAFLSGNTDDINVFFSLLPCLFRYSRAAKLIEGQTKLSYDDKVHTDWASDLDDDPNMLVGALLISKLFYNEPQLKERNVDEIVQRGVDEYATAFKRELEQILSIGKKAMNNENAKMGNANRNRMSLLDKRRSQILPVIKALNAVIANMELRRLKGDDAYFEQLVDQVLQPDHIYNRGMPITYSVLYSAVLNSIDQLSVECVGIPFPRNFLSRIVVKDSYRYGRSSVAYDNFTVPAAQVEQRFSKGGRRDLTIMPVQAEVNFFHLLGNWVGFYSEGMQEVRLSFNKETQVLEARKLDGDQCVPSGEVTWRLDLSRICKKSNMLKVDTPYHVSVQIAEPGFLNPRHVLYTLQITVLSGTLFQPASQAVDPTSSSPYFELTLQPVITQAASYLNSSNFAELDDEQMQNSTAVNMRHGTSGGRQRRPNYYRSKVTVARTHNGQATHPSLTSHNAASNSASEQVFAENVAFHARGGGEQPEPLIAPQMPPNPAVLSSARSSTSGFSKEGGGTLIAHEADVAVLESLESLSFCRTPDLDRCLLDISDLGVVPLTPVTCLEILRK